MYEGCNARVLGIATMHVKASRAGSIGRISKKGVSVSIWRRLDKKKRHLGPSDLAKYYIDEALSDQSRLAHTSVPHGPCLSRSQQGTQEASQSSEDRQRYRIYVPDLHVLLYP
jgi:hypothetical protein